MLRQIIVGCYKDLVDFEPDFGGISSGIEFFPFLISTMTGKERCAADSGQGAR